MILGANPNASEILKYYFKWYNKKRVSRRIKTRIITGSRHFDKLKNAEIRYLPQKYASPLAINIYGDKTAIILWAEKPLAIVIKNSDCVKVLLAP